MSTAVTTELIRAAVEQGMQELPPRLRHWAKAHLVVPRRTSVVLDPEGVQSGVVWLVTDAVGVNDSAYRVVYDESTASFGLEFQLDSGVSWYMGSYGSFSNAVESM